MLVAMCVVIFDITASVALGSNHQVRILHYNPDPFQIDGKTRAATQKQRIAKLLEALEEDEPQGFERWYLFYDAASGATLPNIAEEWDEAAKEVSHICW